MVQLLCIGEAMAELRRDGDGFATSFAGDTFNTAVYCRRLLPDDGSVGYLSRIGRDPLSEGFLTLARAERIDISAIGQEADRNIGIYSVQTDATGERSFHYWRGDSAARQLFRDPADLDALERADILCLSAITLAIVAPEARAALLSRLAALRGAGARIAFDSNYRPRLWPDADTARDWIGRMWRLTDIALPSADDEQALFGDSDEGAVLTRLRAWGCHSGALKCGAKGPVPLDGTLASLPQFPPAPRIVDTTAAGDSFNGAYLAALLLGQDEVTAMQWGHRTASEVIGRHGAIVALPPLQA